MRLSLEHVCEHIDRVEGTFLMGNNIKEELLERRLRWLVAELSDDTEEFLAAHPELKFYTLILSILDHYHSIVFDQLF